MMARRAIVPVVFAGAFALAVLIQCGFGEIQTGVDCPGGCPDGMICADDTCVDPSTGCETVICNPDEICQLGLCVSTDPCATLVCQEGLICQGGRCVMPIVDSDGDGFQAGEECNDLDETIFPGADETCDGVDEDCDGEVDEGFDGDHDGYTTCGSASGLVDCDDGDPNVHPGAAEDCNGADDDCDDAVDDDVDARDCSTGCGDGTETCEGGEWVCDAPDNCECTAGAGESQDCGLCGTRDRLCQSDNTWGEWSACGGEGECSPGATQTEDCGNCGERSRSCTADCVWGSWSSCTGEGACAPGAVQYGGCEDCSQQVCASDCRWGPCTLRPGNECEWQEGTNFQCCGTDAWQYCSSSCHWYDCQVGGGSYTAC